MKKIFMGFSIKKLLLSIICTTIVTTSLGFTLLFVPKLFTYIETEVLYEIDKNSEILKQNGYYMEESLVDAKNYNRELKITYGEEYPAEGIFVYLATNIFKSYEIVEVYSLSLFIGITLGTLIYIAFVQKIKGRQVLIEIAICGIIILLLLVVVNQAYQAILNVRIDKIGRTQNEEIFENNPYFIDCFSPIGYLVGIIAATYTLNFIYQKILTHKLNKKLKNK